MTANCFVLGVHAIDRGFGWILLEGERPPIDWGVIEKTKDKNNQCLFSFVRILERYEPDVLAVETFQATPRSDRIRKLYRSMVSVAGSRGITVCRYPRAEIRSAMGTSASSSRYEIACAVAKRIEAIADRLPKKRPVWESERPNLALFCAAAAALTHFGNCDKDPP